MMKIKDCFDKNGNFIKPFDRFSWYYFEIW